MDIVPQEYRRSFQCDSGRPLPGPTVSPVSVLIIEGNPIFLNISKLLLQKHCCNHVVVVGEAREHEAALEQARMLRPHVVLLDLGIPGLNMFDMISHLRAILPRVGIIVLGLLDTIGVRQAALAAGADEFIPKAMINSDLMTTIWRVMPHVI